MNPTANVQETPNAEPTTQANPTEGRDEKGRFAKGNLGGPGNPFARQCAMARKVVHEAISLDDLRRMFEVVKQKAFEGDIPSVKLILSYRIGRPAAVVDPETLDQHELKKFIDGHLPGGTDVYTKILDGMPVELLLNLLRVLVPELIKNKGKTAAGIINTPPAEPADLDDEFDEEDDEEAMADAGQAAPVATNGPQPQAKIGLPELLEHLRGKIMRAATNDEPGRPMTNGSNGNGHAARPPMTNGAKRNRGRKNKKKRPR